MRELQQAIFNLEYVGDVLTWKTKRLDVETRLKVKEALTHLSQAIDGLKEIDTKIKDDKKRMSE